MTQGCCNYNLSEFNPPVIYDISNASIQTRGICCEHYAKIGIEAAAIYDA